jgi:bifunctional lysine-specific demethylase and histidyl-hydroxylase NO66
MPSADYSYSLPAYAGGGRPTLTAVDRCPSWPRGHVQSGPAVPTVVNQLLGIPAEALKSRERDRPLLSRAGSEEWTRVFSLEAAQQLIDSGALSRAHFDFVHEGRLAQGLSRTHLQGAVARRALSQGCTVLLVALEPVWPGVRDLAVRLSSELEEEVQVNAYLTPRDQVGLRRHADDHDVIVVQLHGRKHWQVFDGSEAPVVETTLDPGDVLYVPRGWEHEVRAETFSLHLTIGLLGLSWVELLGSALASLGVDIAAFNGPVTPDGSRERLLELARHPALDEVVSAARAIKLARSQTCAPPALNLGAPPADPPALDATLVRPAPLFAAALERGERAALVFGGRRVDGPISLRDTFRFIADNAAFRVSDLPDAIGDTVRREIAERLVAEGLLVAS